MEGGFLSSHCVVDERVSISPLRLFGDARWFAIAMLPSMTSIAPSRVPLQFRSLFMTVVLDARNPVGVALPAIVSVMSYPRMISVFHNEWDSLLLRD